MPPTPATWNGTDSLGQPLRWGQTGLTWNGPLPTSTNTRMPHLTVLMGFASMADHTLLEQAQNVSAKLYGNAAYPAPPVTKAAFDAAIAAYSTALAKAQQGSPADTADKNARRDVLIGMLRLLAGYVQINHGDHLDVLLSSGFDAAVTGNPPASLLQAIIKDILNGNSGQLILRTQAQKNVRLWQVRYAAITAGAIGPWQDGGLHGDSRRILINGLTPGTLYAFQARAVAGADRMSDWSDTVQHMSM